jgi:hypothetical protein
MKTRDESPETQFSFSSLLPTRYTRFPMLPPLLPLSNAIAFGLIEAHAILRRGNQRKFLVCGFGSGEFKTKSAPFNRAASRPADANFNESAAEPQRQRLRARDCLQRRSGVRCWSGQGPKSKIWSK